MQDRMAEHFGVTMKERPLGVTMLAVVSVVMGIYWLVAGLSLLGVGGLAIFGGGTTGGAVLALGAMAFALAPVSLGVGYGFWAMKPWAWAAAMAVNGVSIGLAVFAVLLAGVGLFSVLVTVAVGVAVVWYLLQPQVRRIFGR